MMLDLGLLVAGLVILYFGAEALVRGSSSLALRLGISPLVAGLTVVAYGTSMPELAVSIKAVLAGQTGMALGNIVGSNTLNVGVILALAALIQPLKVEFRLVRFDIPLMLGLSIIFSVMLWTGGVRYWMGWFLVALLFLYTILQIVWARREKTLKVELEFENALQAPTKHWLWDLLFILGGILFLALGGRWLVDGGAGLARAFGVSEVIIGLTVIAMGTSAPELASTIVAALRREADIAVGNVVGSNIFNILSVAGVTSLVRPLDSAGMEFVHVAFMLLISFLILPLARTGFVLKRWEGGLLLVCYAAYFFLIWPW